MHQRRWKWFRWNQKKRGRRHRFFSTSKSRPLLLVLCLRVVFSMLPFLVNSDVLYEGNLLPATSSRHLCCCCYCCCSQASSKIPSSLRRKRECVYRALFGLRFARLNPQQYRNREDVIKSKEQFEIYDLWCTDAELHKDDFFYQRAGGRGRGTSVGAFPLKQLLSTRSFRFLTSTSLVATLYAHA